MIPFPNNHVQVRLQPVQGRALRGISQHMTRSGPIRALQPENTGIQIEIVASVAGRC